MRGRRGAAATARHSAPPLTFLVSHFPAPCRVPPRPLRPACPTERRYRSEQRDDTVSSRALAALESQQGMVAFCFAVSLPPAITVASGAQSRPVGGQGPGLAWPHVRGYPVVYRGAPGVFSVEACYRAMHRRFHTARPRPTCLCAESKTTISQHKPSCRHPHSRIGRDHRAGAGHSKVGRRPRGCHACPRRTSCRAAKHPT